ncbi:orotidine-5'-phosphate decarboxylase [Methylophilaceae bacterium]|jgi:orotidine-5'-phosphate decarboxylase|nr:orotidine-5'-phosphate decarboxylase [Methylophilaceae bacterium]|tara:strand:+ start:187 stop:882 length:696 start_codon:yes stop_codon:yes gene_type:complete
MNKIPKLFIAIDQNDINKAKDLIKKLSPEFCGIKVGKELFTVCGPEIIEWTQAKGFKVFLDLKYHDIPNTVEKACFAASEMGVSILNVHALGGKEMMLAAKKGVTKSSNNPYLIAVTVLTSMDQNAIKDIGFNSSVNDQVLKLAKSASQAGLDGIVCSAKDIANIKNELPEKFLYVTPGIRLRNNAEDDQKRIVTPAEAVKIGANILIIGRPITQAVNTKKILSEIIKEIS